VVNFSFSTDSTKSHICARQLNDRQFNLNSLNPKWRCIMSKTISPLRAGAILICLLALTGCDNMNATQQRVLSGAAIGTGVGLVGTAMTGGCIACGAVIGGAAGAAGGYIVDQIDKHN
jgi:osmotically inducible lipoprotein OsmB